MRDSLARFELTIEEFKVLMALVAARERTARCGGSSTSRRGHDLAYIDRGAQRERKLLDGLTAADKRQLNDLLAKLLESLRAESGA